LSRQAARLENIFHNIPGAVIVTDRDGHIHTMNEAARALFGEPGTDLALRDWPRAFGLYLHDGTTLFPAENLPPARALQGVKDVPPVEMLLHANGNGRTQRVSMSAGAILGPEGATDGVTVLVQDMTPETDPDIQQNRNTRHAEGLYRFTSLLAESADDVNRIASSVAAVTADIVGDMSAVCLLEPGSSHLSLVAWHGSDPASTQRLEDLVTDEMDFRDGECLESNVMDSGAPVLIPDDHGPGPLRSIMFGRFIDEMGCPSVVMVPLLGRTGPIGAMTLFRRRGGGAYSEEDRSFLVDVANRTALAVENCLLFDSLQAEISARMTTSQALDLSEERFQSIFESTSLGIKILDLNGNILRTNAAFQRMIGYSEMEMLGRRFYDFLHPADMARAVSVFQKLKREGVPSLRFQHRAVHKNGSTVWVNAAFSAVRKGGGDQSLAFIVSILEDVTEQKKFEAEMAELKNRLQSTMELERLRLAHELHDGPMQGLYSVIYELEELRTKIDPGMQESLRELSENVNQVLNELRNTAKELRPPTISQFGLEKTIRSYMGDFQDKHPNMKIQLSLARDHQLLPEDVRLALFRVLQQSVTNIVRHAEATEVRVAFSFDAEEARLEITDNGKGFPVPSSWIDFVREGHFGLAGAAERISALGGTFAVESRPHEATTVRAVIPWKEHRE
jgi:PAS domain S-box-containing protein